MQADTDPFHVGDVNFLELVEILMVEATEGLEVTDNPKMQMETGEPEEELFEKLMLK